MTAADFNQVRAMYDTDEQMARDLLHVLVVTRLDLELQRSLRRRAEERLQAEYVLMRKPRDNKGFP